MFDLKNLKGKIIAKGLTTQKIAPMLNISEGAMYEKLSGKTEFKRSEIAKLMEILGIDITEIGGYFF